MGAPCQSRYQTCFCIHCMCSTVHLYWSLLSLTLVHLLLTYTWHCCEPQFCSVYLCTISLWSWIITKKSFKKYCFPHMSLSFCCCFFLSAMKCVFSLHVKCWHVVCWLKKLGKKRSSSLLVVQSCGNVWPVPPSGYRCSSVLFFTERCVYVYK